MERTERRDEFFAAARLDPYLHAVAHQMAHAWAAGYEQALREHGLTERFSAGGYDARFERAMEWLTDDTRRSQAAMLIALAEIGKLMPPGTGAGFAGAGDLAKAERLAEQVREGRGN